MALTLERIREIVGNEGYRLVEDRLGTDHGSDASYTQVAEARSSRIEVLQRTYGKTVNNEGSGSGSDAGGPATRGSSTRGTGGTGAIVTVEPSHGHGRRKAIVLSEDGEILGEQG